MKSSDQYQFQIRNNPCNVLIQVDEMRVAYYFLNRNHLICLYNWAVGIGQVRLVYSP